MRNLALILALVLSPVLAFAGWPVVGGGSSGGGGDGLDPANNLCDVDDASAARVCIDAQQQSDILDDLATLGAAGSANLCIYSDGAGSFAYASCTATGLAVLAAADAAAARTAIDAQQESEPLTGISALGTTPANRFLYTVGVDTWLDGIITSDGVALLGGSGAANLAFSPAVVTDWDGDSDPGETDDALDQLAERVDDNEIAIAAISVPSDVGELTYTPLVTTDWDGDADPGNTDDALDQLAERVDDNEIAIAAISVPSDVGELTYTPLVATDWDGDADPGDADDALDQLAERVDDNEIAIAAISVPSDVGELTYTPLVATDWDGDADPGDADDALDQLAERVDDNEIVISGLGALATGDDAGDVPYTCGVDANWTGSLCPGNAEASFDDLSSRVTTLEGASVDAGDVTFTPTTDGDWTGDTDPGNVDDALDDLAGRVETLEGAGGGGSADSVEKDINQAAHGLSVGDWVRLSGADYVKAQANSASNAEVIGVVTAVAGAADFTLQRHGHVTGLSGLTAGTVYFLDASTAGAITATEPTGANVSKPVLVADSTTSGWITDMRGTIAASGAGWTWQQNVSAPSAADWTDANSAGADVSLSTLANCSTGSCVRMVPGASTTDRYGATVSISAGDFVWCGLLGVVTAGVASHGTAQSGAVGFAFVDGTDVDTDSHYGIHSVAASDDFASRLLYVNDSNGGGTDEWDAAWTPDANNGYPVMRLEACFERSGTDLTIYFSPTGAGWVKAIGYTVSADAGLMAVVIDEDDANTDEAVVYSYGDPGGLPWQ